MIGHTPEMGRAYENRAVVYTSAGESVDLSEHFRGQPLVLVMGGPSLLDEDLFALRESGVMTLGVNNSWAVFRPHLWCALDSPGNFLSQGWRDPRIMKFAPVGAYRRRLREKTKSGFRTLSLTAGRAPNTFFYKPASGFVPDTFFSSPVFCTGSHNRQRDATGIRGFRSSFLIALRLAVYLGFRDLYLIGADFRMPGSEEGPQYADGDTHEPRLVKHNNALYRALSRRMRALAPELIRRDVRLTNCTPRSGLEGVSHRPLRDVLEGILNPGPVGFPTAGYHEASGPRKPKEPEE